MVDLVDFHAKRAGQKDEQLEQQQSAALSRRSSDLSRYQSAKQELPPPEDDQADAAEPKSDRADKTAEAPAVPAPAPMGRQESQGFDFQRRRQQSGGILAAIRRSLGYVAGLDCQSLQMLQLLDLLTLRSNMGI